MLLHVHWHCQRVSELQIRLRIVKPCTIKPQDAGRKRPTSEARRPDALNTGIFYGRVCGLILLQYAFNNGHHRNTLGILLDCVCADKTSKQLKSHLTRILTIFFTRRCKCRCGLSRCRSMPHPRICSFDLNCTQKPVVLDGGHVGGQAFKWCSIEYPHTHSEH
jgi:hypothetical protein